MRIQSAIFLMMICSLLPVAVLNQPQIESNIDDNSDLTLQELSPNHPEHYFTNGRDLSFGDPHADAYEDVIVLLVEPSDSWHYPGDGADDIDDMLFNMNGNSMARIYDENSRGQTQVTGYVTDWIDLSRSRKQCDDGFGGYARGTEDCLAEAVSKVDNSIDFSSYDQNGDGYVDNLMIVFNAPNEATGESWDWTDGGSSPPDKSIWPHMMNSDYGMEDVHTNDGVSINQYFVCTYSCNVGTFAHEFGHNLGLPDLYDPDGSSSGIGSWGIMGSGVYLTYNGEENPSHFSPWSKIELGWVSPTIVQPGDTASYTLYSSNNWGGILKVPIGGSEYFLIEYRDKTSSYYDRGLPGSGVLIWHIDESKCNTGTNVDNTDERHPCVGLVQADGANELQDGFSSDFSDMFTDNQNFNDDSNPSARLYDDSESGLQFTVIDVNTGSDYAEVHFGEFTSWFYRMTATPNDSNGDGFNNEILFEYDPDTDGSNVDIEVEFKFYSADKESFVDSFDYSHTIDGSDYDSFEQDVGYYNPGQNGMFWVEAYLWSEGNLCDTVVFGNLWIEYPSASNNDDESINGVIWEMRDTIGDGYNDSVRVHFNLDTEGFANQGDLSLRVYSQENVSSSATVYRPSLDVGNGTSGYIDLELWNTDLQPGRLSGELTLYVDGDREDVVYSTTLNAYWESLRLEGVFVESIDFDLDGNPDTLSVDLDIQHSYRDEDFVTLEMNFWNPDDFNGEPPLQWVFSHRVDAVGESSGGRGIFHWDLHSDAYVPFGYLEIRILYPDGREKSAWAYWDDDYNDLALYPLDWPVDLFSHSVIELDNDVDGVTDTLRVVYDLDTTAEALDVLVELEIAGPGRTMSLWSNITLNGSQLDSDYIDMAAWEAGSYSLTLMATDTSDSTTPVNLVLGVYELELGGVLPSIELSLEANEFSLVGDSCLIEAEIEDAASIFYGFSPTIDWQGTAGLIPNDQFSVDCTGWPAGDYEVQVDYLSQFGKSDSDAILFTIYQPESPEVSIQIIGSGEEVGDYCSIIVNATVYGLEVISSDISWLGTPGESDGFGNMQDCTNWDAGSYLITVAAVMDGQTTAEQTFNLVRIPTTGSSEPSGQIEGQDITISKGNDVETGDWSFVTLLFGLVLLVIPGVIGALKKVSRRSNSGVSESYFGYSNMVSEVNENSLFDQNPANPLPSHIWTAPSGNMQPDSYTLGAELNQPYSENVDIFNLVDDPLNPTIYPNKPSQWEEKRGSKEEVYPSEAFVKQSTYQGNESNEISNDLVDGGNWANGQENILSVELDAAKDYQSPNFEHTGEINEDGWEICEFPHSSGIWWWKDYESQTWVLWN